MNNTKITAMLTGAAFFTFLLSTDAIDIASKHSLAQWKQLSVWNNKASADPLGGYVPPVGRDRIERTEGAGSRGCPSGSFGSLTLLIPNDHIGLTVSGRPTFSWYVSSAPSMPMQFTLVEPGVAKPLLVKQFRNDKSGIIQLELPPNVPELSTGKVYRWTVSLVCNAKRPSENIYVRSWISRVDYRTGINSQSASESDSYAQKLRQTAAAYAQSGIWYDSIASVTKAYLVEPQNRQNYQYLRFLLDAVGLSQVPISQPQILAGN
ncbi:DUF928 domain-containing protein [Planktothrix sp. FACHB-1355]|uniref:DUF928 domain-containing protein n=1 Tax=Aerosakkonema funiforme FACHB-1375 TaxID=2949571 RepID=A0A926VFL4_9CYAN|nr:MULTISPECIES: DUF928 domain-containing protein [Oscillatoriales]MBD2182882.1 DUF928 domain-containing protein [Aerosakkonema funiforme FACHB-1375]MBD3558172.1 DUF928 domain-containing protein [Planktothrix sp. FACHB-1355]